jgi:hypothetical protein
MDALRALDYAVKELEEAKDKSFEEHLYSFKRVLEKAVEIRKEMVS